MVPAESLPGLASLILNFKTVVTTCRPGVEQYYGAVNSLFQVSVYCI